MISLLFEADDSVAAFIFDTYKLRPHQYNRAVGIVKDSKVVGGVLFHFWNGYDLNLSYYGKNTASLGVIRCIARFGVVTFPTISRCTVLTSKKNKRLMGAFQKLGFGLEGTQRCYFGSEDCPKNTAVRFVMFRERIDQLARIVQYDGNAPTGLRN